MNECLENKYSILYFNTRMKWINNYSLHSLHKIISQIKSMAIFVPSGTKSVLCGSWQMAGDILFTFNRSIIRSFPSLDYNWFWSMSAWVKCRHNTTSFLSNLCSCILFFFDIVLLNKNFMTFISFLFSGLSFFRMLFFFFQ
jgi:hypothetical protein